MSADAAGLGGGPAERQLPLSLEQEGIWFEQELRPDSRAYYVHACYRTGPLRPEVLRAALAEVTARHDVLRTAFRSTAEGPAQVVRDTVPVRLDVQSVAGGDLAGTLAALVEQTRFDLAEAPLLHSILLRDREGGDDHLLLCLHHLICDTWGLDLLSEELRRACARLGALSVLPDQAGPADSRAPQYTDHVDRQRKHLVDGSLTRDLAFWRQALDGAEPVQLDLLRGGRRADGDLAEVHTAPMPTETAARVRAYLAAHKNASDQVVFLAPWLVLLSRAVRQRDLTIAVPFLGRVLGEERECVGHFVRTVPLRARIRPADSAAQALEDVQDLLLDAYEHCTTPLSRIVRELPYQSVGAQSLVTTLFQYYPFLSQGHEGTAQAQPGPDRWLPVSLPRTAPFDLACNVVSQRDGWRVELVTRAAAIDPEVLDTLLSGYFAVLDEMLRRPGEPLAAIALPGPVAAPVAADRAPRPRTDGDRRGALGLIAEAVAKLPDHPALIDDTGVLTFRELWRDAEAVAHRLAGAGIEQGATVGLSAAPRRAALVTMLGILRAGRAYLPLDPEQPAPRRAAALARIRPAALFTDQDEQATAGRDGLALRVLTPGEGSRPSRARYGALPQAVHPAQVAYIIHTSGSTGVPKGVAVPYRSLDNLIRWQVRDFGPVPRRTLRFAPLFFDVSVQEVLSTWATGSPLILPDEQARRDPHALFDLLAASRVERLFIPHVALKALVEEATRRGTPGRLALRQVIVAGEQLVADEVLRAFFADGTIRLDNHYGPSETHLATSERLAERSVDWPTLPPIGPEIDGATGYVLDEAGHRLPPGLPGELYLAGLGLASGYANAPGLTAERFLPDPFAATAGGRMYRTGDLARRRRDGRLEFLGRIDQQIKVRGHRVEPGEVESVLADHPAVSEAVVVPQGEGGARQLVAFVVADPPTDERTLREYAANRLPGYLVPARLVALSKLPRTPTGKADRKTLRTWPVPAAADEEQSARARLTPAEQMVVAAMREVLGLTVRRTDDFFALGGHSFTAVRLARVLTSLTGSDIPVALIFGRPVAADLAAALPVAPPRPAPRATPRSSMRATLLTPLGSGAPGDGEPREDDASLGAPLFVVEPAGGTVYDYLRLAEALAGHRPVYGLHTDAWRADDPPTVEEVAADYLSAIRETCPGSGPYHVLGWSFAGVPAQEVARQLGPHAGTLFVVDTDPLLCDRTWTDSEIDRSWRALAQVRGTSATDGAQHGRQLLERQLRAAGRHRMRPHTARTVFVRPSGPQDAADRWRVGFAGTGSGRTSFADVPEDHFDALLSPAGAGRIARIVEECLSDRTEGTNGTGGAGSRTAKEEPSAAPIPE